MLLNPFFNIGKDWLLIKCRTHTKVGEASQCFATQEMRKMQRNPALFTIRTYITVF